MNDPLQVWERARESLRASMDQNTFSRWIAPLAAKSAKDGSLSLAVGDEWTKFYLETNFDAFIRDAIPPPRRPPRRRSRPRRPSAPPARASSAA